MDRYELLRAIAKHCAQDEGIAIFAVAYLGADTTPELLERLLEAIHEMQQPADVVRFWQAYAERYGRQPAPRS